MEKQVKTVCYYLNIGTNTTFTRNIIIDFPVSKIECVAQLDIEDTVNAGNSVENVRGCLHSSLIPGYALNTLGFTEPSKNSYSPSRQVRGDYTFSVYGIDGQPYPLGANEEMLISIQLIFFE